MQKLVGRKDNFYLSHSLMMPVSKVELARFPLIPIELLLRADPVSSPFSEIEDDEALRVSCPRNSRFLSICGVSSSAMGIILSCCDLDGGVTGTTLRLALACLCCGLPALLDGFFDPIGKSTFIASGAIFAMLDRERSRRLLASEFIILTSSSTSSSMTPSAEISFPFPFFRTRANLGS